MVSRDKILDDLARFAGEAATLLGDAGKQANENFRNRIDGIAQGLDLVPRADFERLEIMLETARDEIQSLTDRVERLEGGSAARKPSEKARKAKIKAKPAPGKAKASVKPKGKSKKG